MNKTQKQNLSKLVEEGKYQEVLMEIEKLLEASPKDEALAFDHAFVQFAFLRDTSSKVIEEFKTIANSKSKFKGKAISFLCMIYSEIGDYDKAYQAGHDPLMDNVGNERNFAFAMAKTCFFLGEDYLEEALFFIDKTLEFEKQYEEDPNPFLYGIKADTLIMLSMYNEALEIIDKVYEIEGPQFYTYNQKARANLGLYKQTNDNKYLEEALLNCEISNRYDEDLAEQYLLYAECVAYHGDIEKAIKILDDHKDLYKKIIYIVNKMKAYNIVRDYSSMEKVAQELIGEKELFEVYGYLGGFTEELATSNSDLEMALKFYKTAYNEEKKYDTFIDVYRVTLKLKNPEESMLIVDDYLSVARSDEVATVSCYKANTVRNLNKSYDEIVEAYSVTVVKNNFNDFDYLLLMLELVKDQTPYIKMLKKYIRMRPTEFESYQYKDLAHLYLFGEFGFPKSIRMAKFYTKLALSVDPLSSCTVSSVGRLLEVCKKPKQAFSYYEKAYEIAKNNKNLECTCSYGYLAHAYIFGIGTKPNLEKAKQIVLDAISRCGKHSNDTILLQYAYFALLGDKRFDKTVARLYLLQTENFRRYNLTKEMLLKSLNDSLGIKTLGYEENIKECLDNSPKCVHDYYKLHKNDKAFYVTPNTL